MTELVSRGLAIVLGVVAAGFWGGIATLMDAPGIVVSLGAVIIGAGIISVMTTTSQSSGGVSAGGSSYHMAKLDKSAAQNAAKHAAVAGFIVGVLTAAIIALSITVHEPGIFAEWADPWLFVDVLVIVALSYGLLHYSRFAAAMLLVFYLISQIANVERLTSTAGTVGWIVVVLVFAYFFIQGVRGTFVYHHLRRKEDPAYRAAARWQYILGSTVGTAFVIFAGFGALITIGVFPSDTVIRGDEMPATHRMTLREHGILREDEKVEMFYSAALFSVLSDGNVLTNKSVITYQEAGEDLEVYAMPLREVTRVEVTAAGTAVSDTVVKIYDAEEGGAYIMAISRRRW